MPHHLVLFGKRGPKTLQVTLFLSLGPRTLTLWYQILGEEEREGWQQRNPKALDKAWGAGRRRPEVPRPGGGSPKKVEGCRREAEGRPAGQGRGRRSHPVVSGSVPPARAAQGGCYSAALGSAPSALPSTSSSEHSPAPFRAIRRGTTNGRSPRLGAGAEAESEGRKHGPRTAHTSQHGLYRETGRLTSLREKPRGAPRTGQLSESR